MLPVPAAARWNREPRYDDVRTIFPDDPHDVPKLLVAIPNAQCFLGTLRVAEINRTGKKLAAASFLPVRLISATRRVPRKHCAFGIATRSLGTSCGSSGNIVRTS